MTDAPITSQAVGAFGERAVEAELLRHGWIPSNINATVKNAREFDIAAWKGSRQILVRVKTCSSRMNAFQWGGFKPGTRIDFSSLSKTDFTVLVKMGTTHRDDEFYIIPTHVVRRDIDSHRTNYLKTPKKDGGMHKDVGHWTLHLGGAKTHLPNYGFSEKWKAHRGHWKCLDADAV